MYDVLTPSFPGQSADINSFVNGRVNCNTMKAARRLLAAEQTHMLGVKRSCMFAEVERGSVYRIASLSPG